MTDWHYSANGRKFGPLSREDLISHFADGRITGTTLVWTSEFGPSWKQYSDAIPDHHGTTPPPLPASAVNDFWAWCLTVVPIAGALVEVALQPSQEILTFILITYAAINGLVAFADQKAIEGSGRKRAPIWAAILIVPLYLYLRNKWLGKRQITLAVWCLSFAASIYVTNGFQNPLTSLGLPSCSAAISTQKVSELFPQIPMNFVKLQVKDIRDIREVSNASGTRECTAQVVSNKDSTHAVRFTIENRGADFYYMLYLN